MSTWNGQKKHDRINTWTDPEKETTSKEQLSKHTGPSVLLMFFTNFNIVKKPEQPSSNDLLQAACVVNSGQKSKQQRPNRPAKPAAHIENSGLSCEKHKENNSNSSTEEC